MYVYIYINITKKMNIPCYHHAISAFARYLVNIYKQHFFDIVHCRSPGITVDQARPV